MTKIKPKKGWVIVKEERGQHSIEQAYFNTVVGRYDGICGFGELIYRKKDAERIVKELNEAWSRAKFYVKKAELRVIE